MTEPYLILHCVRGEPAFDIAERCCSVEEGACQPLCGLWDGAVCLAREENWWIVSTSGHKAYPFMHWGLSELEEGHSYGYFDSQLCKLPADWPDHYAVSKAPADHIAPNDLLKQLGLARPLIKRRI